MRLVWTLMLTPERREAFDRIFEEVLAGLPEEVSEMLKEVPVVIDDEPSRELLREMKIDGPPDDSDLCGLHSGLPLNEQSFFESNADRPSQIQLFRGPILRLSGGSERSLQKQIRITLLHEIGHHFGFSEEKLRAMGYD